jgi:ubiquinone/menaquinone biosynthesis C-methylase UbiE
MQRIEAEELLDQEGWSAAEVDCALSAIRTVNRLYGGDRTHKLLFQKVIGRLPGQPLHILEVASGRGEVLQATVRQLQASGTPVSVTLLDQHASHLPRPGDWAPPLPEPTSLAADALEMPLPDASVDVVSCCLFLHHLGPAAMRRFLREALRVARIAVLVNDLERSRLHYILARLQSLIDPSKLSQHDGPASVRQAYTRSELEAAVRELGYAYELERYWMCRLGLVVWKAPQVQRS